MTSPGVVMALTETAQSCSPKLLTLSGRQGSASAVRHGDHLSPTRCAVSGPTESTGTSWSSRQTPLEAQSGKRVGRALGTPPP